MSFWSKIFSGGVSEVVDSVTGGLDKLFTSDEERMILANKKDQIKSVLQTKLTEMEVKVETYIQGQLTKRHEVDMQSDSWLSKNVRPLSLCFITGGLCLIIALAYFGFALEPTLVGLVGDAWKLVLMFYFGGRSVEKGVKMIAAVLKR